MDLTVVVVVLVAAFLHAAWNFFVKSGADKALGMTAVVLGHAPFAALAVLVSPLPAPAAWPYVLVGALLHVGYQLFLLASYRVGDLSQVYPLARGGAPLLVAGLSVGLLGSDLSMIELAAIAVIAGGIMSLALARRSDGLRNGKAAALAAATAAFVASYTLVDGYGARLAGTALGFYGCLSLLNAVVFAAVMAVRQPDTLRRVVGREWGLALRGGGASFGAYALVTWAFTVAPIPLVAALRETSIVIALLLGVFVLKERLDLTKVLSTLCTLLGVCLLRLGR